MGMYWLSFISVDLYRCFIDFNRLYFDLDDSCISARVHGGGIDRLLCEHRGVTICNVIQFYDRLVTIRHWISRCWFFNIGRTLYGHGIAFLCTDDQWF